MQDLPRVKQEVDIEDQTDHDSLPSLDTSSIQWPSGLLSPQPQQTLSHLDNGISSFGDALAPSLQMQSRVRYMITLSAKKNSTLL